MHRPLILHTNDVVKKVGPNCSGTDNFWKSGEAKWSLAAARTNWRNLELWKRHYLFQSVFSGPSQIQRYCSVCWNTETADRPQSFVWDDFPTVEYWQCQCQGRCLQIWKRSEGRISNEMQTLSAPDTWADPTWPQPLQAVQRWPQLASLLEEQSSHASLQLFQTACQAFSVSLARESPVLLRIERLWSAIFFLFGGCSHLSPGTRCCSRRSCWCSSHTWQGCLTQSTESALCLEPVLCFYRFKEEEDSCLPPSGNNDCFVLGKVKIKTDF